MNSVDDRRVIIVGSGIAGLSLALRLGSCTVVTKVGLGAGSSELAQGGLAAALGPDDSPGRHANDTLAVSGHIGDREATAQVTRLAPHGIEWLQSVGAQFDHQGSGLDLGREAGHSRHRIVHASGDASGREVMRALTQEVLRRRDIEVLSHAHALDLLLDGDRVCGVNVEAASGEVTALFAPIVALATGGIGQVYSRTTNPTDATGDGLAMAWRAGAAVRDVEFVQFHPTALDAGDNPVPLLTEALRGAGAVLLDQAGRRFMTEVHDDAELAPRDVVARSIWSQRAHGPVWLDARAIPDVERRFPTAARTAGDVGLDIRADALPVAPAQHFHMGGIAVDHLGRSTIDGLYAVGEVSSTGLHGANRLASNSLVEGVVFGMVVAREIERELRHERFSPDRLRSLARLERERAAPLPGSAPGDGAIGLEALQALMWNDGGIVRTGPRLRAAAHTLAEDPGADLDVTLRNLRTVAELIVRAAIEREESRGAHFRADHPAPVESFASSLARTPDRSPV